MRALAWLGAVGCLVAACGGPTIQYVRRDGHVYASNQRCTQGPLEVHVPAFGAAWGESFEIVADTPRRIVGHWAVLVDGSERARGTFGVAPPSATAASPAPPSEPQNAYCVAAATANGAPSEGMTTPGVGSAPDPGSTRLAPPVGATLMVAALDEIGEVEGEFQTRGGRLPIGSLEAPFDPQTLDAPVPPLHLGADVLLRVWSDEPNDLQGVQFLVLHRAGRPTLPDGEYLAWLRRERAERLRTATREAHDAEENARRERARAETRTTFCEAHHADTGCWGPGGYDGAVSRVRRETFCLDHHEDTACWGPGGYEGARAAERERAAAEVRAQAMQPRPPDGPPPPPRAEVRPPQPSVHAEWVPGYWHWSGFAFGWIQGQWRVPDDDRSAGLTVRAPDAPPAPRLEARPTPPASTAVWTPGYWQWNGSGFIWIVGAWQLPPTPGLAWRPSSWRPLGPHVVFDPGAWIGP